MSESYTDLTQEAKRAYHRDRTRQWRARNKEHAAELRKKHEATWRAKHPSVKVQLANATARIAEAEKVIDALIFEMRAGTLILQGGAIAAAHAWKEGKP